MARWALRGVQSGTLRAMRVSVSCAVFAVWFLALPVSAQERVPRVEDDPLAALTAPSPPRDPRELAPGITAEREWYGGPLIGTYAGAILFVDLALVLDDLPSVVVFATLGALSFLATPLVHLANGSVAGALLSVIGGASAALIGLLAGGLVDAAVPALGREQWAIGLSSGLLVWALIDVCSVAFRSVITITPLVQSTPGGLTVGVGGTLF